MKDQQRIVDILRCMDSQLIEDILVHSNDGIIITNSSNKMIWANQTLLDIMGYSFDEVIGNNPSMFASGEHNKEFYQHMYKDIQTTGGWTGEIIDQTKSGNNIHIHSSINAIFSLNTPTKKQITFYTAIVRNNTERKMYEEQLRDMAFRDSLTGLYNRRYLMEQLEHEIAAANRTKKPYAVILIDLDDFSNVNNTLGHEVGDQLLVQFTRRLTKTFQRETDIVARLGGDEFVILMTDMNDHPIMASKAICDRLVHSFVQPYVLSKETIHITASIGVAICNNEKDVCSDKVLIRADNAMYVSKSKGKNAYNIDAGE